MKADKGTLAQVKKAFKGTPQKAQPFASALRAAPGKDVDHAYHGDFNANYIRLYIPVTEYWN